MTKESQPYVTQGTVQVRLIKKDDESEHAEIVIHPISDYAVKHKKTDYIVFVRGEQGGSQELEGKLIKTDQRFHIAKDEFFVPQFIQAASNNLKLEIVAKKLEPSGENEPITMTIASITIPAKA